MSKSSQSEKQSGCLAWFLGFFGESHQSTVVSTIPKETEKEPENDPFPFRIRDDFLSPAEHSFYLVLKGMMGEHFVVCPKVSLADLFYVVRPNENLNAYNKINRKHVDFVICEPKTMKPMFALELDDSSHERADRHKRDDFVDGVFRAAELPLIHIPVRAAYNTAELGVLFKKAIQERRFKTSEPTGNETRQDVEKPAGPPLCPKCGVPMVSRRASKGSQAGKMFYGCPNYPKCRVVLPYEAE